MRRPLWFWACLLLTLGCSTNAPRSPTLRTARAEQPPGDASGMLARTLPGVVLVVNERPDGVTVFGSGILVSEDRALTNGHVIDNGDDPAASSISVMLYDPNRPSHGGLAEEGGLRRYLFENEKALIPAAFERQDTRTDLALIRIAADTSRYPRPIALARGLLAHQRTATTTIDLTSPEAAINNCIKAGQARASAWSECDDFPSHKDLEALAVQRAIAATGTPEIFPPPPRCSPATRSTWNAPIA